MHRYLSAYVICSEKLSSRKTVSFSEQKMSRDKYPSIFSRRMEAIAYLVKVTRLDQARANENASWILSVYIVCRTSDLVRFIWLLYC